MGKLGRQMPRAYALRFIIMNRVTWVAETRSEVGGTSPVLGTENWKPAPAVHGSLLTANRRRVALRESDESKGLFVVLTSPSCGDGLR